MDAEPLRRALLQKGPISAKDVCSSLKISQPTFSRWIRSLKEDVVIGGEARSTRYALRRDIPNLASPIPIYEIDEGGKTSPLGHLHPIRPKGFYFESEAPEILGGWFDDLPYFLDDLRPNGFLGRLIPRCHPELGAPADIRVWNAEHCLRYWSRFETDGIGDLIVGEEAVKKYLVSITNPCRGIAQKERSKLYPKLAEEILNLGPAGSSAGGEQPKFLAVRGPKLRPVLVKFSPPLDNEPARRIADLLFCEQIAHDVLRKHGVGAPVSTIVKGGKRVFLEIERFDRVGVFGRRGLLSLGALDAQFTGRLGGWSEIAKALFRQKIIGEEACRAIGWLETFGILIANTDRHPGNISFFTERTRPLSLAPAYDMLPMLYFPHHGQVASPVFEPPPFLPGAAVSLKKACRAAQEFWQRTASHPEISRDFKKTAQANAAKVESLAAPY